MGKTFLITGGSGFIGVNLVRFLLSETDHKVVNLDKLTYASCPEALSLFEGSSRYKHEQIDICDKNKVEKAISLYRPQVVMHLAAESHVDRSISDPSLFLQTNIMGTYTLLEACREYWEVLSVEAKKDFRFHHISTDEVYGDLPHSGEAQEAPSFFTEKTGYAPSSPYSASKASSDHLVRAWGRTYGLPFLVTNCSNNYGPYQYREKLIPLVVSHLLDGKLVPVYGDGEQVRDWLYVMDHVRALYLAVRKGKVGETYVIGGSCERRNLDVVRLICSFFDELLPQRKPYASLIKFVADRKGHDRRYAVDSSKIRQELSWAPRESFESGLLRTVKWFLEKRGL